MWFPRRAGRTCPKRHPLPTWSSRSWRPGV